MLPHVGGKAPCSFRVVSAVLQSCQVILTALYRDPYIGTLPFSDRLVGGPLLLYSTGAL